MRKRFITYILLSVLIAVPVIHLLMGVPPVAFAKPFVPNRQVPVDVDPFYKSLSGEAALAKISADTVLAGDVLGESEASLNLGGSALGVGDVELLYADGWQEFTLKAIGDKAEIWVANDMSYPLGDPRPPDVVTQDQVDYLLYEFNENIYPALTTYYGFTDDRDGTEGLFASWGYDWYETAEPQRVMILVYNVVDENYLDPEYPFYVAGYFWPEMNDVYADRNIIHVDSYDWANSIGPDVDYPHWIEQVVSHEYEHAIHYDHDPDEASWVDEGMADLAPFLAGYGHTAGHLAYYLVYHRTPLTVWGDTLEDYGESYLFQLYLMENFGGPAFVTALVNEQANGIEGIENQLAAFGYGASFDDIYRDWTVANYLDDISLVGRSGALLGYSTLDIPSADTWGYSIQWSIENYYESDNHGNIPIPRYWGGYKSGTVQWPIGELSAYTPMYLTYKGISPELISNFRGYNIAGVAAHSGDYQLWGGKGDLLFNVASMKSPITPGSNPVLSFWTYYEIEEFWDFGFVQVSTDGGVTWTSLANGHTTDVYDPNAHPDVVANLPGFTGSSGGWAQEIFDLSAYTGQSIVIRFLYITDWAVSESGFYVDDVLISDDSGTLFSDDLESGSGFWNLEGWQHTTGLVENDWELTFINPIYERGKFSEYEIVDDDISVLDGYQVDLTYLDTQSLKNDVVTIIMGNHLPEETTFSSEYLLLVEKGNAKP